MKNFARLQLFAVVFFFAGAITAHAEDRPNIILIMADDLGVEGLGCYGGASYATPHLDRLAKEGLRFTHAYAQPLCTNTRIQLMTGLYNHRNWIAFGILDPEAVTFGHAMRQSGYATCIAGKWQLQSYDPPDYPGAARRRGIGMEVQNAGFDEYSLWHVGHTEVKGSRYADPVIFENGKFRNDTQGRYGPDLWVDFINDFVRREAKTERPFFVYYSMALPHWPMVPTPRSADWTNPATRSQEDTKYFKDMVEYMDDCVGRIVDAVDSCGISDNTLILFYSDNGTHLKITSQTKRGAVAGGKGRPTNAGTHVPMIARWPKQIKPGLNDDLIDSTDFFPTLLDVAQGEVEGVELDGISFYPQLKGKAGKKRGWIYCYYDPRPGWDKDQFTRHTFARDKRYKLYDDGRLFDLDRDPLESNPVATDANDARNAAVRQRLQAVLDQMAQGTEE